MARTRIHVHQKSQRMFRNARKSKFRAGVKMYFTLDDDAVVNRESPCVVVYYVWTYNAARSRIEVYGRVRACSISLVDRRTSSHGETHPDHMR